MTKARDIASAAPAPSTVSATELGYLDGVSSAIQTQIDSKAASATAVSTAGGSVISANSSGNALEIRQIGAGNALVIEDSTNPDSTPVVVDANGAVGIGTSSLSAKLQIADTSRIRFEVNTATVKDVSTNAAQNAYADKSSDAASHLFMTSGTEAMRIDSGGNIGINTNVAGTYNKQLTINSGAGQYAGILLINNATGTTGNDGSGFYISNSDLVISNREAATISIQNNGGERININSSGNVTINAIADATTTTAASGGGFMGIPQNSTTTGAYTIVAADAGKHIYSSATRTVTIPANSSVAFPVGTALTFVAGSGATVTIAINTDTMYLAGPGTTGSRTLAAFGMATALKITSTSWIISGNGLT